MRKAAIVAVLVATTVPVGRGRAEEQEEAAFRPANSHTIGLRYNVGAGHALGVGYLYLVDFPPRKPFFWGLGIDGQLITGAFDRVDGGSVSGIARVTIGHSPPMTFEVAVGGLFSSEQTGLLGHLGAFISVLYADLGYAFEIPLGRFTRPDWLSSHQFALRVHIPVLTRFAPESLD